MVVIIENQACFGQLQFTKFKQLNPKSQEGHTQMLNI